LYTTALLLAGGRATRMGGVDKGLVPLLGRPMAAQVLDAVRPQVDAVLLNANRNRDDYAALGAPVVADEFADFQGPLAGMAAGLAAAESGLLFTCPCDSPFVPADMVSRMRDALLAANADVAIARDADYLQPVFSLLRTDLLPSLRDFLRGGERKIVRWFFQHRVVEVDFADCPDAFININSEAERAQIEQRLRAAQPRDET
jgi:molybdopterin-guanine dinucleotide biosynthesis protein A